MGPLPRAKFLERNAVDDFVGPPEPGLFDKIKAIFTLPPITEKTFVNDTQQRFDNAAILKPVIIKAADKAADVAGSLLKRVVVVVVAFAFVYALIYISIGRIATKVSQ